MPTFKKEVVCIELGVLRESRQHSAQQFCSEKRKIHPLQHFHIIRSYFPKGFLSTGDDASPGNYGLKDQLEALRWVQKNIAAFGGDANKVTIFGESAGGFSVHYHVLSQLSKGLFHAAIAESGSALMPMFFQNEGMLSKAQRLATAVGCPTDSSEELIKCLRTRDLKSIMANQPSDVS